MTNNGSNGHSNGKATNGANGHTNDIHKAPIKDEDLAEIKKVRSFLKEWRKSCKNTAQLLKDLNGFFRQ